MLCTQKRKQRTIIELSCSVSLHIVFTLTKNFKSYFIGLAWQCCVRCHKKPFPLLWICIMMHESGDVAHFIVRHSTLVLETHSSLQYYRRPALFVLSETNTDISWNDCLWQLYDLVHKDNNREPKNMDAKLLTFFPSSPKTPPSLSFPKVIMWLSGTSSRMQELRALATHNWTDALDILYVGQWRGRRGFSRH